VPAQYQVLFGAFSYVRHVAEPISFEFRAERAVSPLDGTQLWVVLDAGLVVHREASDFLRCLQGAGRGGSPVGLRSPLDGDRMSLFRSPSPLGVGAGGLGSKEKLTRPNQRGAPGPTSSCPSSQGRDRRGEA
jgi:hypothetical protein